MMRAKFTANNPKAIRAQTPDAYEVLRRIQMAREPDREIDRAVAMLTTHLYGFDSPEEEDNCPRYTSSFDVTMALVEHLLRPLHPHMTVCLRCQLAAPHDWYGAEITWPSTECRGSGYRPSLALLSALFQAIL